MLMEHNTIINVFLVQMYVAGMLNAHEIMYESRYECKMMRVYVCTYTYCIMGGPF